MFGNYSKSDFYGTTDYYSDRSSFSNLIAKRRKPFKFVRNKIRHLKNWYAAKKIIRKN